MNNKLAYLLLSSILVGVVMVFANTEVETSSPKVENSEVEKTDFDKMMAVLTHKRCVNCHPSSDYPRQGEDSHVHNFGVQRGTDNHGMPALRCESCHQHENNNFSGVPGAPEWSLAPRSMAWEGLSRVEIAKSMLDPKKNGGRTLKETVDHLTEHELVLWAWEPGIDASGKPREKPPVSKEEYIKAVKAWAAAGAVIPEK
jgi:hypothetical protein